MAGRKHIQKTIYAELLRNCPDDFDEAILLLKAKELISFVNSAANDGGSRGESSRKGFSLRSGRTPFDLLETDIAMNDGGWRVMRKENDLMSDFYEEDSDPISRQLFLDSWINENAA